MRTLEANENKNAEKHRPHKWVNPVPETTAPRPCRHESSVSNKIQQHATKKQKKNRPRQVPECEHIKSPFLPHISFSSAWLAMNPAPWTPENFHRPAEIHLPSGKSIGQIFFRHHRHQKTRPNHVPQKTIPRSTCYWIFLPIPFRRMFLLHDAHQHQ